MDASALTVTVRIPRWSIRIVTAGLSVTIFVCRILNRVGAQRLAHRAAIRGAKLSAAFLGSAAKVNP